MLLRKPGKILLGKATPFHLYCACLFGAWLAFAPGFRDAPALWVVLVSLICVLPVNMGLAAGTGILFYPLSLLIMPASFRIGRLLIDGPTQPLFEALINAPFTALMGFEYYAAVGGLLLGGLLGLVAGWGMTRLVRAIRRGIRAADTNSEKYRQWSSKWWVKLGSWLVFGTSPKAATYEMLEGKRVGMPVRPAGIVVALLVGGAFFGLGHFLGGPYLTRTLQAGLESANGATVDLSRAEVSLKEGRLVIDGLAMADPEKLGTDVLRAFKIEADISTGSLLARRVHIDRVIVTDSSSGKDRETPGVLTGTQPEPEDRPAEEGAKTLDDYLEDARVWRERLAQARRWLEEFSGPAEEEGEGRGEGFEKRLEERVRALGYANVTADHLVRGSPHLSIGELRLEGLEAMQVGGKRIDIIGTNLSTQPYLVDEPPHLSVRAQDGSIVFDCNLASASKRGGTSTIEMAYKGLSGDTVGKQLKVGGGQAVQGGTIDFAGKGTWKRGGEIDLPFMVRLNGTTLTLPGTNKAEKIERLDLPLRVTGPLDDPRVLFREEDLKQALIKAGKKELANRLGAEVDKHVPEDVKKKLGDASGLLDKLKR
ncbi:MAG: hypothetical protein ACYTHK_17250 [Planctomycetota bacterium]|jgi:uncharacterized protein (TIGR03546 family)